jgi:hypothetical protein
VISRDKYNVYCKESGFQGSEKLSRDSSILQTYVKSIVRNWFTYSAHENVRKVYKVLEVKQRESVRTL